ncbi:hypothetical protein CIB48_g4647 [Xylaria polymorpha]|nr:hypothetical protein CIB48_g4647 [Xylaria polymorpha]
MPSALKTGPLGCAALSIQVRRLHARHGPVISCSASSSSSLLHLKWLPLEQVWLRSPAFSPSAPSALAGYSATGTDNISVYWGQNSANGATTQGRLKEYCDDNGINIINVSFLTSIKTPTTNFASAGDKCTAISGTGLLQCPEIEDDIKYCQGQGKTILLSIGGATYYEGGFSDSSSAQASAKAVWDLFGSNTAAANRPFGSAVVDGFDFDFESSTQNFVPFAQQLRSLMDADSSKKYYLSAAPQCVYPDAAMNDMLNGAVSFDWINIQFYNNWCGVINFSNTNAWNFNVWDDWAHNTSKNPNVKRPLLARWQRRRQHYDDDSGQHHDDDTRYDDVDDYGHHHNNHATSVWDRCSSMGTVGSPLSLELVVKSVKAIVIGTWFSGPVWYLSETEHLFANQLQVWREWLHGVDGLPIALQVRKVQRMVVIVPVSLAKRTSSSESDIDLDDISPTDVKRTPRTGTRGVGVWEDCHLGRIWR